VRILFIIDQVYLHGGIERVLSIKANYLASKEDNQVFIVTSEQQNKEHCYEFDAAIRFIDLDINYDRRRSYFHPVNLKKLPRHIKKTKVEIKKIKPDVVVVCSHSADTYFVPFIVKSIPKVKEFHYSKFIEEGKRKRPTFFKKMFFKYADYVESRYNKLVILNVDEAAYYKSNNTQVIPNPLTFYPKSISEVSTNIVITAGRIAHVKGYDILIDIWKIVFKTNPDWKLCIFGDGEPGYVQRLQDSINSAGLQNKVLLKGSTNNIKKEMLNASIFVMTSHNECFPLVLLEAQACGLPIISFDCPYGPRNIVNANNGILVPQYDNEIFAKELTTLMKAENDRKKMGIHARENSKKYQLESIMGIWEDMFNELTTNQ